MISRDLAIDKKLWLKAVDDLQVQNNDLKEGLASILKQEIGPTSLGRLESFQTQLLDKDASIALLRYDITALVRDMHNSEAGVPARLVKLGRDILSMEEDLGQMKSQLAALQQEIGRTASKAN